MSNSLRAEETSLAALHYARQIYNPGHGVIVHSDKVSPFTCVLNDAAFAYRGHGPALLTARILLHFCSVADLVAAEMATNAALFLPKKI